MRGVLASVTVFIAIQTSYATIDIATLNGLKANAATNLQTLTEVAATNLHSLSAKASEKLQNLQEKAASKLQELTENASNNLHEIADNIDLEKLKKLDFLHILPRVHDRVKVYKRSKLSGVKGLHIKGDDLRLAFEGKYPWPVVTRRVEYIYE